MGISLNLLSDRILAGWKISYTSCTCGGRVAWFKPVQYGCYICEGCVCHNTSDGYEDSSVCNPKDDHVYIMTRNEGQEP